jgi:hypothetical protein
MAFGCRLSKTRATSTTRRCTWGSGGSRWLCPVKWWSCGFDWVALLSDWLTADIEFAGRSGIGLEVVVGGGVLAVISGLVRD